MKKSLALVFLAAFALTSIAHADWTRVKSVDGKVSAEFPTDIKKNLQTANESTAAGNVATNFGTYGGDGILISGSGSAIPGLAMLIGQKGIFNSSKKKFLKQAESTETSFQETKIGSAPARILTYKGSNYRGKAVFVLVNKRMYIISSNVEIDNAANKAMEDRVFNSIQVH